MAQDNYRTTILVAVIGLIGTLGAALIANWEKIAGPAETKSTKVVEDPPAKEFVDRPEKPQRSETKVVSLAGRWRDINLPMNTSQITQDGDMFDFTGGGAADGIRFQTSGSGTIEERAVSIDYSTMYQNGVNTRGACTGNVSADGNRLTLTCTDPVSGTYVFSSMRY